MELPLFVLFALSSSFHRVFAIAPKAVCLLGVDEGPCRAQIQRFYYNTITQKCEEFLYGGCQGNGNNFKTYLECQKTCFRIPKIPQICRYPKEVGPCRALHLRYSFNMTTMQCEPFYYGGCQGNANRFHELSFCKEYCSPHKTVPVLCLDPLDKGQCSASIVRYYYNAATKTCDEFSYTGCGGSSNNFVSRQSCTDVCVKARKKPQGPRKGRIMRRNRNKNITFIRA